MPKNPNFLPRMLRLYKSLGKINFKNKISVLEVQLWLKIKSIKS